MNKLLAFFLTTILFIVIFPAKAVYAEVFSDLSPYGRIISEGSIVISTEKNGDVYLIGPTVEINNEINGDLFVISQKLTVNSRINGDVRVIAQQVEIKDFISGSFSFLAETVYIPTIGEIGLDAYGFASSLNLEGKIGRHLNMMFSPESDLRVAGTIMGDLIYSGKDPRITSNAVIEGKSKKVKNPFATDISKYEERLFFVMLRLFHSLTLIALAMIIYKIRKDVLEKTSNTFKRKVLKNFLTGLVVSAFVILLSLTLILSFIGIPPAIALLGVYFALVFVSPIWPGIFIGRKLLHRESLSPIHIILGIFTYDVITLAPFLGAVISIFATLVFIGLVIKLVFKNKNI